MSSHGILVKKIPQEKAKPQGTTTKTVNQVIKKNKKEKRKQHALTEGLHSGQMVIINGFSRDYL